jgi:hypothetical protein
MPDWTNDEIKKIGAAHLLYVAGRRADGTLRNLVPIWVVIHDGRLYIRSVNGRDAAWFRGTQVTHQGHIRAGGIEKDVAFVEAPRDIDAALDDAYRAKYKNSIGIDEIVEPIARAAVLELVPVAD